MARKSDNAKSINVAVVGLSGTEKDKGQVGVGKSCLCNRFMRSMSDDYNVEHISVLSQSDFSGRVVNNDHFLYWGEVTKTAEDGTEFQFQVIEHTEFIDDASFQPFKGGKMEPYAKRCAATKITSAEKLMYICKNQLGIEKEYEQKVLPDGKLNIDGFLCVFDVSLVPNRAIEKQVEIVANILNNLMKTKKPIMLVTTKNDDANEQFVKEAEKLVMRKEYKGSILIVETSAHENINVDLAFVILAQLIDKTKMRSKVIPFAEAARSRKELLDASTESLQRLIRIHVTDYRALWSQASKKLSQLKEFNTFVELFGIEATQRLFRRHIKKLKDEQIAKKIQGYLDMLPDILHEICPDISNLINEEWSTVQQYIKEHPDFDQYFFECPEDIPWIDCDFGENTSGTKIPYDVLETPEAETVFKNHINALEQEQRRLEWKKQFKQLLEETGYVTPGKHLSEVRVLFMGRECFEELSHHDCQEIYDQHQKEIIEKAKHNFQELLLEHADLFYHFKSIAPSGTITQDDIKEITDALLDDFRYKALDRLDQDRKLMLFQHLGFVHCPIREHCPAYPNCMDALIERILGTKAHRPSSWNHSSQWQLTSDNNQLNLVILGCNGLSEEFAREIRAQTEDDEVEIDCQLYTLGYRIIDGDVGLPHNSFTTSDFMPHGSFCIYSNEDSFEYIRSSLEKTLLSNLEQEDRLPFQGLPIVIMFLPEAGIDEIEAIKLREEGQNLADSLQCPFIDVSIDDLEQEKHKRFPTSLVKDALQQLIQSINHRAGFLNIYQSVIECLEPDIRIIMCMFCGDPYSVENVLGPLLNHQCCFLSGDRSIVLETFLGECKRRVEVIISSFHGANAFRDELVHGFILVYSTKRKASLATLNAFSTNIPNLPIQIMAVTDTGGANAFFSNDLSHLLITEGNAIADKLEAHFMTSASSCQQKTAFYTPFFKVVWEKKPEIEQAFNMEEPGNLNDSGEGTLEYSALHPMPPPRHESYHLQTPDDGSGSESYEQLTPDGDLGDTGMTEQFADHRATPSDDSDIYSQVDFYREERERDLMKSEDITNKLSGWVKDTFMHQDGVTNNYSHRAFTTGRRYISQPKPRPKGSSQTLKQPGKINLKEFSNVTDAIARMTIGEKDEHGPKLMGHAPLATPELVDLGSEYAQVKDVVPSMYSYDGDYMYALVQDSISNNKSKLRHRREKGQPSYSDSDSEWSSLERQRATDALSKGNKKSSSHKRIRKKRTAIPVATPKVPSLASMGSGDGIVGLNYNMKDDKNWRVDLADRVSSETPDSSESSDPEHTSKSRSKQYKYAAVSLRKRFSGNSLQQQYLQHPFNMKHMTQEMFSGSSKQRGENTFGIPDDESSLDVSSPREINSPSFGILNKKDGDKLTRKKDKQKAKEDEKLEKRRQKEEKLKKHAEKEKEKEKKKQEKIKQTKGPGGTPSSSQSQPLIEDFAQSETNRIPLFLEKCVRFIEEEGLDSEGIYRVPGNRAHVDLLFQKFEEDGNVDIRSLDIPVNAVATALKDFFSKRLPPLIDKERMSELEDISGARGISKPMSATCMNMEDRSGRLLALRLMLNKLNPVNFDVLKFIFQHFVKIAENCKLNSMDSKNLAICWWPTLLPIEFNDLGRFEAMRPYLEDVVQTMIDQYPFLFCGEDAVVMV